jgi:hypothetical protein
MPLSAGCHASPQSREIPRFFEETKNKDGTKRMQMKMPPLQLDQKKSKEISIGIPCSASSWSLRRESGEVHPTPSRKSFQSAWAHVIVACVMINASGERIDETQMLVECPEANSLRRKEIQGPQRYFRGLSGLLGLNEWPKGR